MGRIKDIYIEMCQNECDGMSLSEYAEWKKRQELLVEEQFIEETSEKGKTNKKLIKIKKL